MGGPSQLRAKQQGHCPSPYGWLDSALSLSYLLHYNLRDTASEVVKWVKSPKFTSLNLHTHMMEERINS